MAKKLLNEATIRRFQSLANISPVNEMKSYSEEKHEDEKKMEEAAYQEADEDGKEKMEETIEEMYKEQDPDPADAEGAPEMDDMEMGEEMDIDLTEEEAQVLIELGKKLEMAMGEGDMEDDGMEAMDDMKEMDPMEEEVDLEESLEGINYIPSQTEVVNEVARRVARRLAEAQKAQKTMNEALGHSAAVLDSS